MTTVIKLPVFVLAIGTDLELLNRSKEQRGETVEVLLVPTCEVALRYLKKHNDANEVWVYPSALDDRNPYFLEKAITRRHPGVRVRFVATSFKAMMTTSPEIEWWILEPKQDV